MTQQQENLLYLISGQRKIVEQFPDDLVEQRIFENLVFELRATFRALPGGKVDVSQYTPPLQARS